MNQKEITDAGRLASRYSAHFLLNCYCREIAGPDGLLLLWDETSHCPYQALSDNTCREAGGILALELPHMAMRVLLFIDRPSVTCNYRFVADPLMVDIGSDATADVDQSCNISTRCQPLAWADIPEIIVGELAKRFGLENHSEFLSQIHSSREILALILDYHQSREPFSGLPTATFLNSERSLFFGHTFHPAPKSRQGFNAEDLARYSPEFHSNFQLHYFAVSPECFKVFSDEPVDFAGLFLQPHDISIGGYPTGWPLIPCHPWQASYLLTLPAVGRALQDAKLVFLGARGLAFSPTASVRTLFNEHFPYFVKASLSLRITNSLRKNAYYELEASVAMSRLLSTVARELKRKFKGFSLLLEPMAATVDLPGLESRERQDIQSHFGVILRENFRPQTSARGETLLAGTVFGDDTRGRSNAAFLIRQFKQAHPGLNDSDAVSLWFARYVKQLLLPVLSAFFEHGVAFEPHLQNVLLNIEDHIVVGITLRDLEGTKLDALRWSSESFPSLSEKARTSMCHSRELAWRRVVYCLFINNLCQAIFHCSRESASETALWALVRQELEDYRVRDGSELCQELLGALLAGKSLPGKANLITRFMQHADSDAHYVDIPNPLLLTSATEPARSARVGELSL